MSSRRTARRAKQARFWAWSFAIAMVIAVASFVANILFAEVSPANNWGMGYGIAAVTILVGVIAWAIRRRTMRLSSKLRFGQSRSWLYFHVYGGLLFAVLVLMHSGFRIPTGILTQCLWVLSLWTVASGIAGLLMQKWIPRVLASGLSIEVLYERIPDLIDELRQKAEMMMIQAEAPIQAFYLKSLSSSFSQPRRRLIYFLDITGGIKARLRRFDYLSGFLSPTGQAQLDELERLYQTKLEIDAHYTLQQPLRYWQYAHVPTSWLMLAFVAVHLFTVFYY